MTNEDLVARFPECTYIHKDDVKPIVNSVFEECEYYSDIWAKVFNYCKAFWPHKGEEGKVVPDDIEDDIFEYFYGGFGNVERSFRDWVGVLEDEFIARKGSKHTFEEACRIAAEQWAWALFDNPIQDNGDETGFSDIAMAMGSFGKQEAQKDVTSEMRNAFVSEMEKYYLNGCQYTWQMKDGEEASVEVIPSCDYGPNSALMDVMVSAGIPKNVADRLAPWKTTVKIDKKDNTVKYCTYGKTINL